MATVSGLKGAPVKAHEEAQETTRSSEMERSRELTTPSEMERRRSLDEADFGVRTVRSTPAPVPLTVRRTGASTGIRVEACPPLLQRSNAADYGVPPCRTEKLTFVHALMCHHKECPARGCKEAKRSISEIEAHGSGMCSVRKGQWCNKCRQFEALRKAREHYKRKEIMSPTEQRLARKRTYATASADSGSPLLREVFRRKLLATAQNAVRKEGSFQSPLSEFLHSDAVEATRQPCMPFEFEVDADFRDDQARSPS